MRFLLVGDNRSSSNWGGRAGSMALFAALREAVGRGASVHASEMVPEADYGYRTRVLPASKTWLARVLASGPRPGLPGRMIGRADRLLGGGDYLVADPSASVDRLLAWRGADPGLADLHDRVAAADVVVINGEGDVVFTRPVRRQVRLFMALIELARRLGKPVVFANAMLSDCSLTGRDDGTFAAFAAALRRCDLVVVRDERSLDLARREMGLDRCRLVPDSLFLWFDSQREARAALPANGDFIVPHPEHERYLGRLDFSTGYICVGGTSYVNQPGQRDAVVAGYRRLLDVLETWELPVYVAINDGPDAFLEDLARERNLGIIPKRAPIQLAAAALGRARLFVSGRYHPSIMAALGGTPCVLLATNAHKMQSLAKLLGYREEDVIGATVPEDDLPRLRETVRELLAGGEPLRRRLQAVAGDRAAEAARLAPLVADIARARTAAPARARQAEA